MSSWTKGEQCRTFLHSNFRRSQGPPTWYVILRIRVRFTLLDTCFTVQHKRTCQLTSFAAPTKAKSLRYYTQNCNTNSHLIRLRYCDTKFIHLTNSQKSSYHIAGNNNNYKLNGDLNLRVCCWESNYSLWVLNTFRVFLRKLFKLISAWIFFLTFSHFPFRCLAPL